MTWALIKPPLLVTAAILRSEERVMLARRPLDRKVEAGKWEFPGGKVESGEKPEDSLMREIREELDLDIRIERYFDHSTHVYMGDLETGERPTSIVLLSYICRVVKGEPRLLDVAEIKWVTKAELRDFDYAAADVSLVRRLEAEWDQVFG